jgi:hypothetical protein
MGGMVAGTKRSDALLGSWETEKAGYEATIDVWDPDLYLRVASTHRLPVTRTWGVYMGCNAWIDPFPFTSISIRKTNRITNKTSQKFYSRWCVSKPGATLETGIYFGSKKGDGNLFIGIEYGYFDRYSQKKRISVDGKKMDTFFRDYKLRIWALSARIAI